MNITHTMDLNELAEHMGRDATQVEAMCMRDLLISHDRYSETGEIPEDEWLEICGSAAMKAQRIAEAMPMTKAQAIERLANDAADAAELAEARAIAKDDNWDEGSTTYTFDDDSQLICDGPSFHAK